MRPAAAALAALLAIGGCRRPARKTGQATRSAAPIEVLRGPYLLRPTSDGITIAWHSGEGAAVRVEYGTTAVYGSVATGRAYRIPLAEGVHHEVALSGLDRARTYHYRVVTAGGASTDSTFRVAATAGEPVRLVAFGDTRTNAAAHQMVIDAVVVAEPDVVVQTGDLVEWGLSDTDWARFFEIEKPLLRDVPCYPALGNHDVAFGGDAVWAGYFRAALGPGERPDYSFDDGPLHVAVLSSENAFGNAAQVSFLDADLAAARARGSRFLAVAFHRPLYTSSVHPPELLARSRIEPVLLARGVHLVLQGHNHLYERFEVDGVTYVTTGGGGAPTYPPSTATDAGRVAVCPALASPPGTQCYHYVQIDVPAEGAAQGTVVRASDRAVIDRFAWTASP